MSENPDEKASTGELQDILRRLPSVDTFINLPEVGVLTEQYGRILTVAGTRSILERWRLRMATSGNEIPDDRQLLAEVTAWLNRIIAPTLRTVINATGVIVHTNLGRAPPG